MHYIPFRGNFLHGQEILRFTFPQAWRAAQRAGIVNLDAVPSRIDLGCHLRPGSRLGLLKYRLALGASRVTIVDARSHDCACDEKALGARQGRCWLAEAKLRMISERNLLEYIEAQPQRAAGYKQLVRELSLRGRERQELESMLAELVVRGKLVLVARERYAIASAAANRNLVVGTLTVHRDGFGFVRPLDAAVRERFDGDIFIPPFEMAEAMHGDQVLVELAPQSRGASSGLSGAKGRSEGRVIRVMERAHPTVVGTFHYGPRHNYVRPIDDRIKMDVVIPEGAEIVPDAAASRRDRVIGSEAGRRPWEDLEGLAVDCEITDWPTATKNPRGRIIEVLGHEDDFGVDVEIVIRKHHLPHQFPSSVLDEARHIPAHISPAEIKLRRDFRGLPIVTIDGETARDFDDAVLVRTLADGHYELQVHIADVAHYVRSGMDIDREAEIRGTSVYFPDRAIPMLPIELSTDICSLRPHLDRLVMSCIMRIDARGEIRSYEIVPGVIRSAERMTYEWVQLVLDGDRAARTRYAPLVEDFLRMQELAEILNQKRRRRGSIDFDLPEPLIEFDENGLMKGVTRSERLFSHRLIEEFMLAANETVATYLEQKGVASLYRVHEPPDPKRVFEFETLAAAFGYSLGLGALPVSRFRMKADQRAARSRSTAGRNAGQRQRSHEIEVPREVAITPAMYQKLADKIAGKPEERILSYLMLRSLKQARYSEINEGHFALAATCYTHFTSPIRRYPDLLIHRILKGVLASDAEEHEGALAIGAGRHVRQHAETLWSGKEPASKSSAKHDSAPSSSSGPHSPSVGRSGVVSPISEDDLHHQAEDASFAERRADAAERELVEWKKMKFMADRIGEDFDGLIISVTKYGIFVELADLFVEGLIPLNSLFDDRYTYHENTRQIIGQRSGKTFSLGDRVRVVLDRIDPVERKLQFSILEERPTRTQRGRKRRRY
jgi:ribonuclease R